MVQSDFMVQLTFNGPIKNANKISTFFEKNFNCNFSKMIKRMDLIFAYC